MLRWIRGLWPTISDRASALLAVERAVRVATLWAIVNSAIGLISILSNSQIMERSRFEFQGVVVDNGGASISGFVFLLFGAIYGVIAWKLRDMSRAWSLGALALTIITSWLDLATAPSPFALLVHIVVILYFIHAVRATAVFERSYSEQPIGAITPR